MPVTRFDQPAQHRFIDTFSPIPFEDLSRAAASRQGVLDENLARLDAAQVAAGNLRYIPNSVDQQRVEAWQRDLSTLADEYVNQDLSDPEIYRKLRSGIKSIVDPADVQRIQSSYAGYEAYQKQAAQMQARGQRIYRPTDFAGYNTLDPASGIFTGLPMVDLGAEAEGAIDKFMTKPQVDYREVALGSGRVGIEHYRDINKINALIESGEFGQLLNNPAIQQLMEREGMNESTFKTYLQQLAPEYEQAKLTSAAYPPGFGKDTDRDDFIYPSTSYAGGVTKAGIAEKDKFIRQATPDAEELVPGLSIGKEDTAAKHFGQSVVAARLAAKTEQERDAITAKYREYNKARREKGKQLEFKTDEDRETFNRYIDATSSYFNDPSIAEMTPKKQLEKVDEYIKYKYTHQRNPEVVEYTESYRPEESKVFKNQIVVTDLLDNRDVYDPSKPQDQALIKVGELKSEYPTSEYTWTPIGETTDIPRQEISLGKQVSIRNTSTGESVGTYFIAGSEQEKSDSQFDNALVREMQYGDLPEGEFDFQLIPGVSSKVRWQVQEQEGQLPVYTVFIQHEDGTGIGPVTSTSFGDLRRQIWANLQFFSQ